MQRVVDSLAPLMGLLSRSGDVVLVRASGMPDGVPDSLKHVRWMSVSDTSQLKHPVPLVPWGWDAEARLLANELKTVQAIPSERSVGTLNHRSFQAKFDDLDSTTCVLPLGEQFGRLCHEIHEVEHALNVISQTHSTRWIIKAAYSASGRNRLVGAGRVLSNSNCRWIEKRLATSGSVYLEPSYNVISECGIQFQLESTDDGRIDHRLCGVTELLTDRTGRYRGSLISAQPADEWLPAIARAERMATEAGKLGYFGPLGIDCMKIQLQDGTELLRVGHDVNGRHTMGRLALALLPLLDSSRAGCWIHGLPSDPADRAGTCPNFPATGERHVVESVQTSPQVIGGAPPAIQTQLLVTSSLKDAQIVAKSILAQAN